MNFFLYTITFIIGVFFGSFFTLAVYRIPRKEDILIKHSYCPNCNHKLGFFDLFPVLSYVFLKGKCRYCGDKIRPRYLILELLSGLVFFLVAVSMKLSLNSINSIINVAMTLIYISILFIIAGIDKENKDIQVGVVSFGYFLEILYIIYQCTLEKINVYQYVIYLISLILILVLYKNSVKFKKEIQYFTKILYLMLYMIIFCGIHVLMLTILLMVFINIIYLIIYKKFNNNIHFGFCLSICNIIIILISNIFVYYIR